MRVRVERARNRPREVAARSHQPTNHPYHVAIYKVFQRLKTSDAALIISGNRHGPLRISAHDEGNNCGNFIVTIHVPVRLRVVASRGRC